jgi:hypothetical protein
MVPVRIWQAVRKVTGEIKVHWDQTRRLHYLLSFYSSFAQLFPTDLPVSTTIRFLMTLALCTSLLSCSSPQSQERVDTVLCWLRPSCLPSELPSFTENASQIDSQPNSVKPGVSSEEPQLLSPKVSSLEIVDAVNCLTSANITVTASNPVVGILYVEPTTKANGEALTNLAKTTIYKDTGKGFLKYKDIWATKPEGGGTIQEKVPFSLRPGESVHATICITATDSNGQEG